MLISKKRLFAVLLMGSGLQNVSADTGYSLGAEYSEGDYDTGEDSSSWYIPFSWRYGSDALSASITIPYLIVEGSSLVTVGGTPLTSPGVAGGGGAGGGTVETIGTTRSDSGLGDIVVSGGYTLMSESDSRPWLGATAKVKFGTADVDKGLGTGENDYTFQLEAARDVLYGYVGYSFLGDSPTVDYNNVSFVGVALNLPLSDKSEWGVEYYTEAASVSGRDDIQEVTLSVGGELNEGMDYSLYYVVGLSDSSADSVIGINFSSHLK